MSPNWDVMWLSKVTVKVNHTEKGGFLPLPRLNTAAFLEPELSHGNTWQDHRAVPQTVWKRGLTVGQRKRWMSGAISMETKTMEVVQNAHFAQCLLELYEWWLYLASGRTRCPQFYCAILCCLKSCLLYLCVLRENSLIASCCSLV